MYANFILHWCSKSKEQSVLMFSSFEDNSWINEHKNMRLRWNIYYEIINWILDHLGFGNNLQMNANEFFLKKNYFLKKGKMLMFFGKETKWKVVIRMHYNQAEIDIPQKITLQSEFFLLSHLSLMLLTDFLKLCIIFCLSTMKYRQNNKKM